MSAIGMAAWTESNRAFLAMEFDRLRALLNGSTSEAPRARGEWDSGSPPAIDVLAGIFNLGSFERDLLLLCAGVEMESDLGEQCGRLAGRPQRGCPTFGLAMSVLPNAEWQALAPWAPLRRYRMIDVEPGHGLSAAPLRIDERILHFLAGINRIDPRLEQILQLKTPSPMMAEEHEELAARFASGSGLDLASLAIHLYGDDATAQENIAARVADGFGRHLFVLRAEDCPAPGHELEQFLALWSRESLLLPAFLLMQCRMETLSAQGRALAERLPGPLFLACRDPQQLHRVAWRHEVNKPDPAMQRVLWEHAIEEHGGYRAFSTEHSRDGASHNGLPERNGNGETGPLAAVLDCIAEQFRLSADSISLVARTAMAATRRAGADDLARRLWEECRAISRPQLDLLAERIAPRASWDDLVLPLPQSSILRMLVSEARNRMTVYERWGFARRGRRGLGLSALFSGPSGTGKTLAAEVVANELELDLYRIDLSSVVSKYIGETEKNLKRVFDAAEQGGVVLLFDEAEALFGKRSEVKDSHDRYANIEVGYLLQRMDTFQGVAILTTNAKTALDKAFQRRLRFAVDFPFPSAKEREAIWRRAIPPQTPSRGLEPSRLAQLNMAGGSIRNVALNAAFLAAAQAEPVEMRHALEAAQLEAAKEERPIAEIETRGWL